MNGKTIGFVHGFIFKGEIIWTLSNLGMKGLEMSYNSQNSVIMIQIIIIMMMMMMIMMMIIRT